MERDGEEDQSGLVAGLQMRDTENLGLGSGGAGTEWQLVGFDQLEVAQILPASLPCSVTSVWRVVEIQEAAADKTAACLPHLSMPTPGASQDTCGSGQRGDPLCFPHRSRTLYSEAP